MSTTAYISATPRDSWSWHRIGRLIGFYLPRLRKQMIIFPIASLVLASLLLINAGDGKFDQAMFVLVFTALPYWFALGPLSLTSGGDARPVERMLPALPAEKFFVQMVYILVVIPLMVYALPVVAMWLRASVLHLPTGPMIDMIYHRCSPRSYQFYVNLADNLSMVALVFYIIWRANRNRVFYSIIAIVCYQIFLSILGGIYGMIWAFRKGYEDGLAGREMEMPTPESIMDVINIEPLLLVIGGCTFVAAVVLFSLSYRQIAHKQF